MVKENYTRVSANAPSRMCVCFVRLSVQSLIFLNSSYPNFPNILFKYYLSLFISFCDDCNCCASIYKNEISMSSKRVGLYFSTVWKYYTVFELLYSQFLLISFLEELEICYQLLVQIWSNFLFLYNHSNFIFSSFHVLFTKLFRSGKSF
jgi:hypothetical protein